MFFEITERLFVLLKYVNTFAHDCRQIKKNIIDFVQIDARRHLLQVCKQNHNPSP